MPAGRRTVVTLLIGLALGALLTWGGVALARASARLAPSGHPPEAPAFPARVVAGPTLRGDDVVLTSVSFTYYAVMDAHWGDARPEMDLLSLLRHRSLRVPDFGVRDDEPGLMADLQADAEARGWEVVPDLTVDAGVAYQALGLRQGRWVVLALAFGDTLAPDSREEVADDAFNCCTGGTCPPPPQPGLASCEVEGFVPILVWTNLPREAQGALVAPDMAPLAADDRAWSDPPTWEDHVARAAGG